jgi:amidase
MTDVEEVLFRPAIDVAALVQHKQISARELTEALLGRIEAVNPSITAVVELRAEKALSEADGADRALAEEAPLGPLHGVPMTVKDSFDVKGLHTTWGNPAFADYVAESDATVVRRLKDAGAIVIGKTNVHFMLADFGQTANELYGVTSNPWDTQRTPGGSSGGGAAALAAGLTFLEYGSDLVGSIRIPASFCGVYGLKPSVGVVPLTGFQVPGSPPNPPETTYMSAVGPLARSASDLRTAFESTAGPERPASNAYSWQLAPPRHSRLDEFRVGFVFDHERAPVSSEVAAVLSKALKAIGGAGATIVEGWPEGIDPVAAAASFGFHVDLFFAYHEQEQVDPSQLVAQQMRRLQARAAWGQYFNQTDVFLCPANFTPAFPHDTRSFEERTIATPEGEQPYDRQPFWVSHASLPGLPAVVAPVGATPSGLPVGLQILGPLYEDDTALTFVELLAEVAGSYERPPI